MPQLLLHLSAFGDVADGSLIAGQAALFIAQGHGSDERVHDCAVSSSQLHRKVDGVAAFGDKRDVLGTILRVRIKIGDVHVQKLIAAAVAKH